MSSRLLVILGGAVTGVAIGWFLFVTLPSRYGPDESSAPAAPAAVSAEPERKIKATIFSISPDGMRLVGVEREIPFEATAVEQARRIVEAQLEPGTPPQLPVVPAGTKLRAIYVTDRGEAYVDLSREVTAGHSGGSLSELYTVYAIVNAVTVNLPAVTAVQILVEGQEVDTLAGHVDLRQPLQKNFKWIEGPADAEAADGEAR